MYFLRQLLTIVLIVGILGFPTVLPASEKDLYNFLWLDPDKKVYVLQNKIHKKSKPPMPILACRLV